MKNNILVKWSLFVLLCLTWGSSFILMKAGLTVLSAYQVASIRIISAGLIMLPLLPKALRETPRQLTWPIIFSGFLGTFFPAYLFCFAETVIASSLAGILNSTTPLFTIIIGAIFFKQHSSWKRWVGICIGFIGMILPLLTQFGNIDAGYLGFYFLITLATILYGLNANVVSYYLKEATASNVATLAFTALVIPTLIILAMTGFFNSADLHNSMWLKATGASMLLGIAGTCIASVMFYMLMKNSGPVFASMVTYGIPFVAILWGIQAGETVGAIQILGLLIILLGVRLANK